MAPMTLAASTGSIQRTNAHPFKYRQWLFQHNGYIREFDAVRRDLHMAIAPELYGMLRGTTDSETFFLLALTYGLEQSPKLAFEKTIGFVIEVLRKHDIEPQLIFSCALSDGRTLYTLRYASGEHCHSQYYSTHTESMKALDEANSTMPRNSVVVVSEPLDQSIEHWQEMPGHSFAAIRDGQVEIEKLAL